VIAGLNTFSSSNTYLILSNFTPLLSAYLSYLYKKALGDFFLKFSDECDLVIF
jgi:hypothetical protein